MTKGPDGWRGMWHPIAVMRTWWGILARNSGSPGGPNVSLGSCHHRTAARAGTGAAPGATARCASMTNHQIRHQEQVSARRQWGHRYNQFMSSRFGCVHRGWLYCGQWLHANSGKAL